MKKEYRIALRNAGKFNPEQLSEYEALGGTKAMRAGLQMDPEKIIDELTLAKLRGRGGNLQGQDYHGAGSFPAP